MAVQLTGVQFSYGNDSQSQLLDIGQWGVERGERVLIHGPSGAGKTTLLNIMSGLLPCTRGDVSVLDQRLDQMSAKQRDQFRANNIGCVFQRFNLIPYLNAIDNIDIVDGIQVRDEIETLENAANVVCSKLVSLFGGHLVQALVQHGDVSTGARQ